MSTRQSSRDGSSRARTAPTACPPATRPWTPYLSWRQSAATQKVLAGTDAVVLQRELGGVPGQSVTRQDVTADQAYQQVLASLAGHTDINAQGTDVVDGYRSAGPVGYRARPDGHLTPTPARNPSSVWASRYQFDGYVNTPASAQDQGFRQLTAHEGVVNQEHGTQIGLPVLRTVGRFDPSRLPGLSRLSAVPLETYNPPVATGADSASRRALGGAALQPNADPAGYLCQPAVVPDDPGVAAGVHQPEPLRRRRLAAAGERHQGPGRRCHRPGPGQPGTRTPGRAADHGRDRPGRRRHGRVVPDAGDR